MINEPKKPSRPRNIADDIIDAVETATSKWTRQKKSEERHPGNIRYRASRMTREPRTTQKEAAWEVMEQAYMAASGNGTLPASARQIYYQARPKIMAMTDDKELAYGYFSQILLPNYIEEHGAHWDVVYDARGHFTEPHTNRRIGCGTIEVGNYLHALKEPRVIPAEFADASVDIIGPSGGFSAILFCEKEGFAPLFKAVDLANRYDLMIISTKGVSVTAARKLVDNVCGYHGLPLFVLHDFDVAGFLIIGTLQRDTRRYQFASNIAAVDLGLRLDDIEGLEQEPAAATRTSEDILRGQLAENGATDAEIDILVNERVELNAMPSDDLIEMIERKLKDYGLEKVVPDDDLLADTYRAFHHSQQLREKFEEIEEEFEEEDTEIEVPQNLKEQVRRVLDKHGDLRWDDAVQIVLDETQLDRVRAEKQKARKKSGDFIDEDEDEEDEDEDGDDGDDE
jgi:Topoisomerase 6 subunit A/Spo11, Toprim domain